MKEKLEQMQEIERRVALYCSDKKVITRIDNLNLRDRTVILADDGAPYRGNYNSCVKAHKIFYKSPSFD